MTEEQDKAAMYWEEVEMLVDGVVDGIRGGEIHSREEAYARIDEAVSANSYVNNDELAATTLAVSGHPTAHFFEHGKVCDDRRQPGEFEWDCGRRQFPWGLLACEAMKADCRAKFGAIQQDPNNAIPEYSPEEGDDGGEEAEEDPEDAEDDAEEDAEEDAEH